MSRSKLDVAVNIAILATCVIASTVLVRREFFPAPAPAMPGMLATGEHSQVLQAAVPTGADRALILAIAPNCHFCNESMDFYKQLIARRDSLKSPVKVVAIVASADNKPLEQDRLHTSGVKPDDLVEVNFQTAKLLGTPAVVLVDRQGKVLSVWAGKLDPHGQEEVLKTL
jgi:thioredoxin-related protein